MKRIVTPVVFLAALLAGLMVYPSAAEAGAPAPIVDWIHHVGLKLVIPNGYAAHGKKVRLSLSLINRTGHTVTYRESGCGPPPLRSQVLNRHGHILWGWRPNFRRVCPMYVALFRLHAGKSTHRVMTFKAKWHGTVYVQALATVQGRTSVSLKTKPFPIVIG